MFELDPYTPSRAIADCFRVGQSILREKVKDLGVEVGQADCLFIVANNPGISQSKLSDELFISQAATARMVKTLCEKGFLVRERDRYDSRIWRVSLGPQGQSIEKELVSAFRGLVGIHNEALTQKEQIEFQRLLNKTLGHLIDVDV